MSEEKLLKKWLKRKITITKSLLISFLITGVIGYSETPSSTDSSSEIEMLKTKIAELEAKVNELETSKIKYVSIKSENGENIDNDGATGKDSIAIGKGALAVVAKNRETTSNASGKLTEGSGNVSEKRTGAISIGLNTISSGSQIAIGKNARFEHSNSHWADGYSGIVIGENALSQGPHIAIGQNTRVKGNMFSIALGNGIDIEAQAGAALGYHARVYSNQGIAIGYDAQSGNQYTNDFKEALKSETDTKFKNFVSNGYESGTSGIAIGYFSRAEGQSSVAVGSTARALNFANTAIGENAYAIGSSSQSFGANSKTLGSLSLATGYGTLAIGKISSAYGSHSRAYGYGSVALGYQAIAGEVLTEEEYNKLKEYEKNSYVVFKGSEIGRYDKDEVNKNFYIINDTQKVYHALAVGTASNAVKYGTSLGNMSKSGIRSISVGYNSNTSKVENSIALGVDSKNLSNNSVTVGNNSSIYENSEYAIALGTESNVKVEGGVSLGYRSSSNIEKGIIGYDPLTNSVKSMEDVLEKTNKLTTEIQELQNKYDEAKEKFLEKANPYNENIDKLDSYKREKEQIEDKKRIILRDLEQSPYNYRPNRDEFETEEAYNKKVEERKVFVDKKMAELKELYEKEKIADENIEKIKSELNSSISEILSMPEYTSRGELLKEISNKKEELNKLTSTWKSNSGAVSIGNSKEGITRQLINLAAGTEDTDAVNVAQLKGVVKLNKNLQNAIGLTDDEINKINDDSINAEDKPKTIIQRINDIVENGLKDKDLTNKVNSLRNGESGLIVYTDEDGNNLVKSEDGKFYKSDSVEITDGKVVVNDNSVEIKSEDIKHSLVNIDGTTKKESILGNVAKGVKDTDAVNVAQLNDVVTKALNSSSFANSDLYEDKTDEDGNKLDKEGNKLVKDETDGKYYKDNGNGEPDKTKESTEPDRVLKGIKFVGNIDTKEYKKTLGEEVKIFGNSNAENANDYSVKNVLTENTTDGILIKMSDMPEFKKVVVSDDTGKSTTITPDGITIKGSNGNDGKDGKTATIKIDKDGDIVINNEKIITNGNFEKIEKNSQSALSGVASSMAMAAIPQVIDKNRPYTIGAATALYKGESALAVGISGVNKTGNLIFKASSSINSKLDLGAAIGVSYAFGNGFDNSLVDLTSDKSDFIEYVEKLETKLNDKDKEIRLLLENQKNEYDARLKALEEKMGNLNTIEKNYENIEEDLYENTICSFNRCVISGFDNDSYVVSENNKEFIREMVEILNTKVEYAVIDVIGHTDSKGKFNYNVDLGLQRAKSVAKLLKEYGLKKEIVFRNITSSADISDIFDNTSKKGRSQNRRVELHFDMIKYK